MYQHTWASHQGIGLADILNTPVARLHIFQSKGVYLSPYTCQTYHKATQLPRSITFLLTAWVLHTRADILRAYIAFHSAPRHGLG